MIHRSVITLYKDATVTSHRTVSWLKRLPTSAAACELTATIST